MVNIFKTTDMFGLGPAIMDYFAFIPENEVNYNYYKLRHPGEIYNLVTTRLITDVIILSHKVTNYNEETDDIYPYFRMVLYDLFKFYDSCFEIMLCFAEKHPDRPTGFVDRWLEKKHYMIVSDFKDNFKNDVELIFLKNLYNKLKHTSSEIRFLKVNSQDEIGFGYWLEVANDHGGVEPDSPPTSIASEIRRIQYMIYKISDALLEALKVHVSLYFPDNTYLHQLRDVEDTMFFHLHETVRDFPLFFLKSEKHNIYYKSNFLKNNNGNHIEFSKELISEDLINKYFTSPVHGGFTNSGDGYTRQFAMPHMGLTNEKLNDFNLHDISKHPPKLI
ncbi:hypothetical protein J2I47_02650 [Fibrella sp. HMF5335]|uniref:Uncharacterized protein n=1 Tax=Fibrella rubiginis TaxID=2817060 RepID=A0A939K1N6_9BACT|nr:hypothetical protein [Fibrella rubiginis]MBO0935439.1 hypothetical protein [Fibrella rubiginis]